MGDINYQFRALVPASWPRKPTPAHQRKRSPFKAGYGDTIRLLTDELAKLDAREVVIDIDLPETQIRNDGLPRAGANPASPAVILNFVRPARGRYVGEGAARKFVQTKPPEPFKFPCDAFTEWQDNLRAIALGLEALRKVARYGIAVSHEQYAGYRALPPAIVTPAAMGLEDAARFVARASGGDRAGMVDFVLQYPEWFQACYRAAAKRLHPDSTSQPAGPDWQKLQEAAAMLRKHHGL